LEVIAWKLPAKVEVTKGSKESNGVKKPVEVVVNVEVEGNNRNRSEKLRWV